jgi:hypothetical protein
MRENDYIDAASERTWRVISAASLDDLAGELTPPTPEYILFVAADVSTHTATELTGIAAAILATGAGYVCCWGPDGERLHDAFDAASGAIGTRADGVVMTMWDSSETLEEAVWFATHCAFPDPQYAAASQSVVVAIVDNADWLQRVNDYLAAGAPITDD